MIERFKNFISRLEAINIGFGLWLATALGIILIRDGLESLVSLGAFPIPDLFHLLHVPIFFISLFLAIILVLHFFSGVEIIKVSRVGLVFFSIILLPVLLDFFISLAVKRDVVYQYIMEEPGKNFLLFLNPFVRLSQITFSLRVEIACITILSFIYIRLKRNRFWISLLGAFCVFALCVFYGSIPAVLTELTVSFFRFLIFMSRFIYLNLPSKLMGVVDESVVVIIQLLLTFILLMIWFWRYDARKSRALWRNFRWMRVSHYILLVLMGVVLYFYDVRDENLFILFKIIGTSLAMFFACQFCAVTNDIFDKEGDRISNRDRPLVAGALSEGEYLKVGFVYLALALCFAVWVSGTCLTILLSFIALYFIYSAPPFRLKRFYPLNPVIIGIEAVLAFLLGQMSLAPQDHQMPFYPSTLGLLFVIFLLSSHIKDLKDIEGDRAAKVLTLPVLLGKDRARRISAAFVFLSYLLAPFLFSFIFYRAFIFALAFLFGAANFFYIRKQDSREKFIFATYLIFGTILLALLIQAVFFS